MTIRPADLRSVPLFQRMSDAFLEELIGVFERTEVPASAVLFEAGAAPTHFLLLVDGEIGLYQDGAIRFRVKPLAPIGELGSIAHIRHNCRAVAETPAKVWRAPIDALMQFFERRGEVAFPFYHSLLTIVSDKVRRDERRLEEMRANLIRTQKTMKRLRDRVLETVETPLSAEVVESLDALIENNRKGHYMVEPAPAFACHVRLDGGFTAKVHEVSDAWLRIEAPDLSVRATWSGVLVLPNDEVPLSGVVDTVGPDGAMVKLDMLIDDYRESLEDYLTRVQMLDFVV
ncbi:MAG: Crp/Fnr family transcriptional regulator [Polyangiales bacterium]